MSITIHKYVHRREYDTHLLKYSVYHRGVKDLSWLKSENKVDRFRFKFYLFAPSAFVSQRDMTYNADVKIFAWSRSWKCLGCFLFNWFVVFSEQDGVYLGSKANKFLNGYSMGGVFHFSQHLFVSCAIQKMVS